MAHSAAQVSKRIINLQQTLSSSGSWITAAGCWYKLTMPEIGKIVLTVALTLLTVMLNLHDAGSIFWLMLILSLMLDAAGSSCA